ncbi:MAG: amidohydrolase family protein [Deltaproteobacteria bacterium]|nr:amidohydrolase family protein [Deltaproteobacteria bacterium]
MPHTVLLKNARLIDGLADQPQPGMSILVTGERISQVERGEIPPPPDAQVIDLGGKTVLPGLIDTHVHSTLMDREALPLFLAAGVTSARDVGAKLETAQALKADLNSGAQLGPRLFIYGPLLDGVDSSFPPRSPLAEMLESVPSVEAVPQKIGRLLAAGVDGVKLYFTLPPDTAQAIIKFVDKRVPITGHLGYTHSLDVIKAGIDGLEHVWISPYNDFCALDMQFGPGKKVSSMMTRHFAPLTFKGWEEADLHGHQAATWFDAMVEQQVHMGTTLDLLWISKCGQEAAMQDPDRRYIPPMALARQRQLAAHIGERPDWDMFPGFDPALGTKALDKHQEVTRMLHEAGGLVVGGTDCGGIPYPPPGFALWREIELLAEAIGSMAALKAVTSVAARYLRQQEHIGSIAPGRYADFMVVDGDPLRDTRELRKLTTVYRGGKAYEPQTLLAGVPKSEVGQGR